MTFITDYLKVSDLQFRIFNLQNVESPSDELQKEVILFLCYMWNNYFKDTCCLSCIDKEQRKIIRKKMNTYIEDKNKTPILIFNDIIESVYLKLDDIYSRFLIFQGNCK